MNRPVGLVSALLVVFFLPPGPGVHAASSAPTCGGKPATMVGTPGPDRLVGRSDSEVIVGLGGADHISGGMRLACGGRGADEIVAAGLGATIFGGPGDDVLDHEQFYDGVTMFGGRGDDTIDGYSSLVAGGPGDDTISSGFGTITYASSRRPVRVDLDRGLVFGQGRDRIDTAALETTRFADHVFGWTPAIVFLEAAGGDDVIRADAPEIYGQGGDDTIHAGTASGTVSGGGGDDVLYGGKGDDLLYGFTGVDTVSGGPGKDLCRAEHVSGCERS